MSSNTLAAFGQYVNRSANVLATTAKTTLLAAEIGNDLVETGLIAMQETVNGIVFNAAEATAMEERSFYDEDDDLRREAKRMAIRRIVR